MNQGVRPKHTDEYECSGPRPPVPGQESRTSKMTEGSSFEHNYQQRTSPPSHFKWDTLKGLLEDPEGLELFSRYVQTEGAKHYALLNFYFCCVGLKQQTDDDKARVCIVAIFRKFFRKRLISIPIPDNFKEKITSIEKKEHEVDRHIFDSMQEEALLIITKTTYHNFFKSDVYIQHIGNAMGSAQGGCTSTSSSSGNGSGQLARSTLATVVEDQELSIHGDDVSLSGQDGNQTPMRLTRDLLLATQRRRLEVVRPPGTHGYSVYNASLSASYNPVSRQDSERQSCSSGGGGKSDSDTMSVTSSRDGRPHVQRRQSSMESKAMQHNALINKETNTFAVIPRTQRQSAYACRPPSTEELLSQLIPKLEQVRRDQQLRERLNHQLNQTDPIDGSSRIPPIPSKNQSHFHQGQVLADALFKRLQLEDDDQSILDQHVSRVWSDLTPHRSPGTISPCPAVPSRRRTHDFVNSGDSGQSMRHSKSMPEHASSSKRLTNKWPSMNTDSGISLFSTDATVGSGDFNSRRSMGIDSIVGSSDFNSRRSMGIDSAVTTTAFQLEEARRRLEDESRRSRRYSQHPAQIHQLLPTTVSSATFSTVAVYTYLDEELPYRSKLPGSQPTLRQFKEYLPKKGNFRFFFKTACEDPDNPIIQEEIVNDDEILPLFEGKVMGLVKPCE